MDIHTTTDTIASLNKKSISFKDGGCIGMENGYIITVTSTGRVRIIDRIRFHEINKKLIQDNQIKTIIDNPSDKESDKQSININQSDKYITMAIEEKTSSQELDKQSDKYMLTVIEKNPSSLESDKNPIIFKKSPVNTLPSIVKIPTLIDLGKMSEKKEDRCVIKYCNGKAVIRYVINKSSVIHMDKKLRYCYKHYDDLAINENDLVKRKYLPKLCSHEECKKLPKYGYYGPISTKHEYPPNISIFCLAHKEKNMNNILSFTCSYDKCRKKMTLENIKSMKKGDRVYCLEHINKCNVKGCEKYSNKKLNKVQLCDEHFAKGLRHLKRNRDEDPEESRKKQRTD